MFDALDIELKNSGGDTAQWSEVRRYLTWRGMPGYRHRALDGAPCVNPPDEIGVGAVSALQQVLDLLGSKRVLGWSWSAGSRSCCVA